MSSPLQNRATPFGEIVAVTARGGMMGNRGGRLHDADRRLGRRRWASKAWICCVLDFKGRRRRVMGPSYTEIFFLDEAVAMAAGHRPCFECRRLEAQAFAAAWAAAFGLAAPPRAPEMDARLHAERLAPRAMGEAGALPAGAMFAIGGTAWLRVTDGARAWGWDGYGPRAPLPAGPVEVLTPAAMLGALRHGFRPRLHPGASD
ncbi:MAG: hypothetical protein VYD87_05385 [Pseudomonadota bacterium]|nr:hypothetical protein [Pseudomonadota bacterium]